MKSLINRFLTIFWISTFFIACTSEKEEVLSFLAVAHRTTMDQSKLLEPDTLEGISDKEVIPNALITLNPEVQYQSMDGFGFTLNGGSAMHLQKMSSAAREKILKELFSSNSDGIKVNYLRLSVGSSDLDESTWSYDDCPKGQTDDSLALFSLAYDTLYLIPTLKEILKLNPKIKLMGSPWSPPAWMKDNNETKGGSLLPKYFTVYANYLVKYIRAMEAEGIPIDAITVQNEPLHPGNNPSLLMLANDQATFIKNHLGPAFQKNNIKTKIIIYDHNADRPEYPISILNDSAAAQYIDGSAFHLYGGKIDTLTTVHETHPDKNLYFTEQWIGAPSNFKGDVSWHIENVIIGAPRNWCKTALEWNLAADENQLPHTDGGCDRCLGAITIIGDSVIRNPAYYIVAHASKFVPVGSVRIESNLSDKVNNVAFKTPNGEIIVILQNKAEEPSTVRLKKGEDEIDVLMTGNEILTLVWSIKN